jgi:tripartite-type tricarboxylate transporter receptor subunit TctC
MLPVRGRATIKVSAGLAFLRRLPMHRKMSRLGGVMNRIFLAAVLAAASNLASATAQVYPSRPITVIVPTATGGLTDVLTRTITQRLAHTWGQTIIIENRGGAGHNIGAAAVAKSAPDGYTLMAVEAGTFVANPFLYAKLPYDVDKDFEPITGFASISMGLLTHPSLAARNVRELIELAKKRPGEISYGTSGIGGVLHISVLLLETLADVKLVPVHYRGAAPALNDLLGGHINLISMGPSIALPQVRAGQLNMLAVGSAKRLPQLPDVPTLDESGVRGYEAATWFGLFAPARTPREVLVKIHSDVQRILSGPEFQRYLTAQLLEPMIGSSEHFAAFIKSDAQKWGNIIRKANLTLN